MFKTTQSIMEDDTQIQREGDISSQEIVRFQFSLVKVTVTVSPCRHSQEIKHQTEILID